MGYTNNGDNSYTFQKYPVVVEFTDKTMFGNTTKVIPITTGTDSNKKDYKIVSWGKNNDLCDVREALIVDNNIIPQLLRTSRNIMMGTGIFCYKENYDENGKRIIQEVRPPDNVMEALMELEEDDYWEMLGNEFVKNGLAYIRYLKDANGEYSIKVIRSRYVRPEEMDENGLIQRYFLCGNWKKKTEYAIKAVQSHQYSKSKGKFPTQFIKKISDDFLGNEYFPIPVWWTGNKWIEIGNKIPEFHTFNLENTYFVPVHIEIPQGYFYDEVAVKFNKISEEEAKKEENEKRKAFLDRVDKVLAGHKNAGKAVWSEYFINQMQKEYGGIKITPLDIPRNDDALLDLFEKTNEANISGTGVHPSLAAIMTESGLSSGSEIRNALEMYIITQALQPRKQLLKPLYILKRLNGWDKDLKFGFRDIQLTTTDKNPTGSQAVAVN